MVVMLHLRLRRVTCGCHVASGLHQWEKAQEGDLWQQWEEAQEGDLWLSCCIRTASMGGGSGGQPVVVMLHQDCISGRRLRRVTCGCHVASGLHQWEEAQEGDLWLSCCIYGRRLRRVTCGCHVASGLHQWEEAQEGDLWQQWEEAQEGDLWLSCCIRTASMGGGSGG